MAADDLPKEWIDPDTGHRVTRVSNEPGTGSLCFHQNAYSADSKELVVANPHEIATINLATREVDRWWKAASTKLPKLLIRMGDNMNRLQNTSAGRGATQPGNHAFSRVRRPDPGVILKALPFVLALSLRVFAAELPTEWIDPDTGHRIIRLSKDDGTMSLYFNQNAYTADGKKLIVTTPGGGISTITLATREIKPLVEGPVSLIMAGHKTGDVYYTKREGGGGRGAGGPGRGGPATIYATNVDTGATHEVVKLPPGRNVAYINSDETLGVGSYVEGGQQGGPPPAAGANAAATGGGRGRGGQAGGNQQFGQPNYQATGADGKPMTYADAKDLRLHESLMATRAGAPRVLFTINFKTGEVKDVLKEHEWLNHFQFSPTDPNLILFCHEGTWHEVDRVWSVRTDGSDLKLIHKRTMNMEIAGHEFFNADGSMIWYDLQTPRGQDFWLAGYNVKTAQRTWYHLLQNEWSVHYNVSPDGSLFAGDGGDSEMVARAPDGKWIYLFRPERVPDVAGVHAPNADSLIDTGFFKAEKLVNMSKHDYRLEPNVTFSPDMKWIVFRSNMLGPNHVFAVEIAKAKP
jgi:oligogalacturonide lyase